MMPFILGLLTFLEVVCALFLIIIILMQRSKSGGGLGPITGGFTEDVFGSSAGNVLTKTTVVLAIFFFVNTLVLAVLESSSISNKNLGAIDEQSSPALIESPPKKEVGSKELPAKSATTAPESLPLSLEAKPISKDKPDASTPVTPSPPVTNPLPQNQPDAVIPPPGEE